MEKRKTKFEQSQDSECAAVCFTKDFVPVTVSMYSGFYTCLLWFATSEPVKLYTL